MSESEGYSRYLQYFSIIEMTSDTDLMKGFVSASRVRINQEGWTIIKDFKFFLNLYKKGEKLLKIKLHITYGDKVLGIGLVPLHLT